MIFDDEVVFYRKVARDGVAGISTSRSLVESV